MVKGEIDGAEASDRPGCPQRVSPASLHSCAATAATVGSGDDRQHRGRRPGFVYLSQEGADRALEQSCAPTKLQEEGADTGRGQPQIGGLPADLATTDRAPDPLRTLGLMNKHPCICVPIPLSVIHLLRGLRASRSASRCDRVQTPNTPTTRAYLRAKRDKMGATRCITRGWRFDEEMLPQQEERDARGADG